MDKKSIEATHAESNGAVVSRKVLEEANKDLQKFKNFYDSAPIGFYRTSLQDGLFLMANPACIEMLGCTSFEQMQKSIRASDLYPKYERQKFLEAIQEHGKIGDYEIGLTLLDGQKMIVLISGTMCEDEDCIEGSITNITDKRDMQKRLDEYKLKGLADLREMERAIQSKLEEYDSVGCEPAA